MKISILGCGFGTALAVMLDRNNHEVTAWTKYQGEVDDILRDGEHKKLLPGVIIPPSISFTSDISKISGADLVITAIPSPFVREAVTAAKPFIDGNAVVLNVGKGFEDVSLLRLSEVVRSVLGAGQIIAVMAGPCHAEEVGRGMPTTVVAASDNSSAAAFVQEQLMNDNFRVYVSSDVVGCELGAALKNPIALCCGILQGMGFGDNTLAALMTRGLAEITRLATTLGAVPETLAGLSGVGDLFVTCTSAHSRNHRAGLLIGQGMTAEEAVRHTGTVEGYACLKSALELARTHGVETPIFEQLEQVCFERKDPRDALKALMSRPRRGEAEDNC